VTGAIDAEATEYEVVLLRHGETVGYDGDLGLTERGEQQARDRGIDLAGRIKPGTTVRSTTASTPTTGPSRRRATRSSTGCTTRRSTSSRRTSPRTGCGHGATITFRDHEIRTRIPPDLPPWIDRAWFESYGRR
jgi:hypothetical protein